MKSKSLPTSSKITLVVVVLAVIAAAGFVFYRQRQQANNQSSASAPVVSKTDLNSAEAAMKNPEDEKQTEVFASPDGFTFVYPKNFKVGRFEEGEGDMVLVQQPEGNLGFQIYTSPFDEAGPLTVDRIKKDIPDQVINNPKNAALDGAPALVFDSKSDSLGQTYEVWLVHNKTLFQISTTAAQKDLLTKILNTWKWQEVGQ